jgi:hypothetical protein
MHQDHAPVRASEADRLRALEAMVIALAAHLAQRDPTLGTDLEAALLARIRECESLLLPGERIATRNLLASLLAEMAVKA